MKRFMAVFLTLVMLLSLTACGGKKKGSALAGYYTLTHAEMPGMSLDLDSLKVMGMAEGVYLQLNEDGTGELCMEVGKSYAITFDEKAGTVTVPEGSMTIPFTVDGDNISLAITMEGTTTTMTYTRVTGSAPSTSGAASGTAPALGGSTGNGSFDFGSVTVASSLADALDGVPGSAAPATGAGTAGGFVSPTTTLKMDTTWYGTMTGTNAQGPSAQNFTKDVIGYLSATANGRPYFEISTDVSMESQYIMFSAYVTIDYGEDGFTADIGDEDAWVINRYLTPEEWWAFSPTLNNGALEMNYHYVDPDDGSSFDLLFFLREDGTEWDEENDPLPPTYEEYKAAISK